ncbi:hypothetical protein ACFWXO_30885 [Kitasatospora sp. NPDC059088]|uniref:hypothetical protein n=1 Tax=Kitasatospora sp. NPDC059088 TaxID=3346722 RepID=UPI0036774D51
MTTIPLCATQRPARGLRTPLRFPVRTPGVRTVTQALNYTGYGHLAARPLTWRRVGPVAVHFPGDRLPGRTEQLEVQATLLRHGYAGRWIGLGLVLLDPRGRPRAQRAVTVGHDGRHGDEAAVVGAAAVLMDAGRSPALLFGDVVLAAGFRVMPGDAAGRVTVAPEAWAGAEGERACVKALAASGWRVWGEREGTGLLDAERAV